MSTGLRLSKNDASTEDVEVRFEDQQMINEFGRSNAKLHELKDDVQKLMVGTNFTPSLTMREIYHTASPCKVELRDLDDATDDIALVDGEEGSVKFLVGDSFCNETEDTVTELIEKKSKTAKSKMAGFQKSIEAIEERQGELKKYLYGRFGSSINLEE